MARWRAEPDHRPIDQGTAVRIEVGWDCLDWSSSVAPFSPFSLFGPGSIRFWALDPAGQRLIVHTNPMVMDAEPSDTKTVVAERPRATGVPEMIPENVLIERPAGRLVAV